MYEKGVMVDRRKARWLMVGTSQVDEFMIDRKLDQQFQQHLYDNCYHIYIMPIIYDA